MPSDDPFSPVFPGDRQPSSARLINRQIDAARRVQRTQLGTTSAPSALDSPLEPASLVFVQAGADGLDQFTVSTYGAPVIPLTTATAAESRRRPIFAAGVPAAEADEICITVESAPPGGFARAVCAGTAVVKLDVSDEEHTRAVPVAGDSTKLASAATGGYPIVAQAAGTGMVWAMVLLPGNASGIDGGEDSPAPPAGGACLRALRSMREKDCIAAVVLAGTGDCANFKAQTLAGGWSEDDDAWVAEGAIPTPIGDATFREYRPNPHPRATLTIPGGSGDTVVEGTYIGCKGAYREYDFSDPRLCTAIPVTDCEECEEGAASAFKFTASGGTGDYAGSNGEWTVTHDSGCLWVVSDGDMGWSLTNDGEAGAHLVGGGLTYAGTFVCCGPMTLAFEDGAGDGTPPTLTPLVAVGPCVKVACAENSLVVRAVCAACLMCDEWMAMLPLYACIAVPGIALEKGLTRVSTGSNQHQLAPANCSTFRAPMYKAYYAYIDGHVMCGYTGPLGSAPGEGPGPLPCQMWCGVWANSSAVLAYDAENVLGLGVGWAFQIATGPPENYYTRPVRARLVSLDPFVWEIETNDIFNPALAAYDRGGVESTITVTGIDALDEEAFDACVSDDPPETIDGIVEVLTPYRVNLTAWQGLFATMYPTGTDTWEGVDDVWRVSGTPASRNVITLSRSGTTYTLVANGETFTGDPFGGDYVNMGSTSPGALPGSGDDATAVLMHNNPDIYECVGGSPPPPPPPPLTYACNLEGVCIETVGGPYVGDPTCGGDCTSPPPPPPPFACCGEAGEQFEAPPSFPDMFCAALNTPTGTTFVYNSGGGYWSASYAGAVWYVQCLGGTWYSYRVEGGSVIGFAAATAVTCTDGSFSLTFAAPPGQPFALVFTI